jgi:hypothetical protein
MTENNSLSISLNSPRTRGFGESAESGKNSLGARCGFWKFWAEFWDKEDLIGERIKQATN